MRKAVTTTLIAPTLLALALLATACGNSPDPQSWDEAEATGDVYDNFIESCRQANEGIEDESGAVLTPVQSQALCHCTYEGLRISLSFAEFQALDDALRSTPNPSDLDGDTEDAWDDEAERIVMGCLPRALR